LFACVLADREYSQLYCFFFHTMQPCYILSFIVYINSLLISLLIMFAERLRLKNFVRVKKFTGDMAAERKCVLMIYFTLRRVVSIIMLFIYPVTLFILFVDSKIYYTIS
jgi:hypothetical protein